MGQGLAAQLLSATATFRRAQETRIGQLSPGGVFVDALAGCVGTAFDVEQIVGYLKQQSETPAKSVQFFHDTGIEHWLLGLGRQDSEAQASPKQGASLAGVQVLQVRQ
jgi:hypothetical protein